MNPVRTGFDRHQGVDDIHSPVSMSVPIDPDRGIDFLHQFAQEDDERAHPLRRGMTHGVRGADAMGAGPDCGGIDGPQGVRVRPGRVFGDEHNREPMLDGETDRLLGLAQQEVKIPSLGILPDWTRAEEDGRLDGDAGIL